jgi:hypothetical protein
MLSNYKNKAIADRYPDPPPKPAAWSGWRRRKSSDEAWVLVEGTTFPTKGETYQELMRLSELVGMDTVIWEYAIMPQGERPQTSRYGSLR